MAAKNKLLTVLSEAEQYALYGLPDFDDDQRLEYLALSEIELELAASRPGLHAQVYCILQIGYFKAKHSFFRFDWNEVEDDCAFVLSRYFIGDVFERKPITNHEYYTQRGRIAELFGYRLWTSDFLPQLAHQVGSIVRRDVSPGFIAAELLIWLNEHKIIRPGYTTLQELISETLSAERRRLGGLLAEILDDEAKAKLNQLLVRDDTLSQLAALKQDAKNFGWLQMAREREKRTLLEPLHRIAKALLPKLDVSQQNLLYYASIVAYTLLCNHIPLNGYLIGAHEYEAHHVFDIWYRNTSDVMPTAITGDMHSVNKANFVILYWYGLRFEPRFTDLNDQLQELYCADDPALYDDFLIKPVGQIDIEAIAKEKPNIDQIVATLGLKEMTQGTLIRKLCTIPSKATAN